MSTLEECSWLGATQIHVYLYLANTHHIQSSLLQVTALSGILFITATIAIIRNEYY